MQIGAVYLGKVMGCPTQAVHRRGAGGPAASLTCSEAGSGGRQRRQAVEAGSLTWQIMNISAGQLGHPSENQQYSGGVGLVGMHEGVPPARAAEGAGALPLAGGGRRRLDAVVLLQSCPGAATLEMYVFASPEPVV